MRIKIGDVFSVRLDENTRGYFQYIADDQTQLNSMVIRVFAKRYPIADIDLVEIISGEVQFYTHVVIRWGLHQGLWDKVGNIADTGETNIVFRDTNDCVKKVDEPPVQISHRWYVWTVNGAFHHIGTLRGRFRDAEIGVIVTPGDVVNRMRTGKYRFVYPD